MRVRWIPPAVILLLAVLGGTTTHASTPYPSPVDADSVLRSLESGGRDSAQSILRSGARGSSPGATPWLVPPISTQTPEPSSPTNGVNATDGVWAEIPPLGPTARDASTGIYDPIRHRFLAFGGYDIARYRNDVWQLPLGGAAKWTRLIVAGEAPAGRSRASAIYDAAHDRMVIFGGWNGSQQFGDVWALSLGGSPTWNRVVPAGEGPSPRSGHTATYDAANDRMLVFGGTDGTRVQNDVWGLSLGSTAQWSALLPLSEEPTPRHFHSAIYDAVRDRMVVFAGDDFGPIFAGDAWALSLSPAQAWTRLPVRNDGPRGIIGHSAVYDVAHDRMIVYGGAGPTRDLPLVGDAWSFSFEDGITGTLLHPQGTRPLPRIGQTAIYDPVSSRMIMFGGWDGANVYSDLWALSSDYQHWTALATSGGGPPRTYAESVYDPIQRRMIIFGGYGTDGFHNDLWSVALDGSPAVVPIVPDNPGPSPRDAARAVFDPVRNRMLLFGGNDGGQILDDLWEVSFDGVPHWTRLTPSGDTPGPRLFCSGVYDPLRRRWVIFGGGEQNDSWALSLDGPPIWTRVLPLEPSPSVRAYHAAVYDPVGEQLVVYGGFAGPAGLTFLGDVWKLTPGSAPTWEKVITSGATPGPRDGMTAIYDPGADRLVVFGGNLDSQKNDVWALPLRGEPVWQELTPTGDPPAPRCFHAAAYDETARSMIAFGGFSCCQGWMNDAWSLSLSTAPAWTRIMPTTPLPGPVYWGASTFYDERRGRMLLVTDDLRLWALQLSGEPQWTEIVPQGPGPTKRVGAAVVLDPLRDRLVVQGGVCYGNLWERYQDTWELPLGDPSAWRELSPSGQPPEGRDMAAAAYDPVGDRMLLFGGHWDWDHFYDDLWSLSLAGDLEWSPVVRSEPWPKPRILTPLALDPLRGRLVLFGGYGDGQSYDDLWSLSVDDAQPWSLMTADGPPPGAQPGQSLVYDAFADRMLMLGFHQVWALSFGTVPTWSLLQPAGGGPSLGRGQSAIFDISSRRILVYGGDGNENDLWELRFDEPTPVTVSLVSAEAGVDHVALTWYSADGPGLVASVERRTSGTDWTAIGAPLEGGDGMIVFRDERTAPGTRYGYRLRIQRGASSEVSAEVWVEVPARLEFALAGVRPNPSRVKELAVEFVLASAEAARLELIDVTGRRVLAREVGGLGRQVVDLAEGANLTPGLYLVRLTQGANTRTKRVAVLR